MSPLPPLTIIPPDIRTLADYERHAVAHLPAASWQHIQGGIGRNLTLSANRHAFDAVRFLPRALTDLRGGGTGVDLFGRHHASPILLAPLAYQRIAHPDGELATARAAMALGAGMVVSTLSSIPLEDIAETARQAATALGTEAAPLWFQLYLQEDRAWSAELIRRAEAAGYKAIVLTVDTAIKHSTFILPSDVDAANLRGWPKRRQTALPGGKILFGTPLLDKAPRWEDLAWLRGITRLPVLVKGIMSPDDARIAADHGADGIIISNHGGRVLDGLPSPLEVMPAMVAAIGGKVPLLLDSGIRSGSDIAKAIGVGASAVLIGRPQFHALAVAGTAGVAHVLHILRTELEHVMAQLGCRTLSDIADRIITP
ncbi:MAG: alpha-hydroxy-acid oxidizing protein [Sphingomonadales bacterium]|nr:alpha-hydroxy-acid oxidizing protein [Sphingomonadales bacterium]